MKSTALPPIRGPFHDLLPRPTRSTELPFIQPNAESEDTLEPQHDFLVQNRRPDLVSTKTPDQTLNKVDLP